MRARTLPRVLLLALLATACSEAPTSPVDPQFSFVNGPGTLANVARTAFGYQWVSFEDAAADLTVFVAPFAPICGGTQFVVTGVQEAGVLRGVVKTLQQGPMFVTVYSGIIASPCATPRPAPLAQGKGHFAYLNNNGDGTATRNSTWGWRITGQVQGTNGTASLLALFRFTRKNGVDISHAYSIKLTPTH